MDQPKQKLLVMETMPAIKIGFCQLMQRDVDEINDYIDTNSHRLNDLSYSLVGQIKQNPKSAQYEFNLDDPVPQKMGNLFASLAKEYADNHPLSPEIRNNIGPVEDYHVKKMWSVHSYAGDYNPLHEHGTVSGRGVSMIVFLKVPPQIAELEPSYLENTKGEKGNHTNLQHGNSGATDGVTQFVWDAYSMYDVPRFKHSPFANVYPQVGKICVFPIWLLHQVSPFYGEGERRTMSCNVDIINHV